MLVTEDKDRMLDWLCERVNYLDLDAGARAIGWERNGALVGVVAYDRFSYCDCSMHVASDGSRKWLNKEFLAAVFAYPFIQCDLKRVTGPVAAKNRDALRFDLKLGFRVEGRCPRALPNDDLVILGMLRSECRFIPVEYRR